MLLFMQFQQFLNEREETCRCSFARRNIQVVSMHKTWRVENAHFCSECINNSRAMQLAKSRKYRVYDKKYILSNSFIRSL